MAMVTHRPGEKIANVVSFVEGYPIKPGSEVRIDIGGSIFDLFTKDDSAWARTAELDRMIVTALGKAKQVVVRGTPQKGTATTDTNGSYSFTGLGTSGNCPSDYHLWAMKAGYGFYPSVGSGAKVIRADHTGQFETVTPTSTNGIPMYLEVIDFVATANNSVSSANFAAYDGTNPVVSLAATGQTGSFAGGDDDTSCACAKACATSAKQSGIASERRPARAAKVRVIMTNS